jgi:hypothetical protein
VEKIGRYGVREAQASQAKSKAKRYSAPAGTKHVKGGLRSREPMQMPRVVSTEKIRLSGKKHA